MTGRVRFVCRGSHLLRADALFEICGRSQALEQEAEPSDAFSGAGSLGHAGGLGAGAEGLRTSGARGSILCFHVQSSTMVPPS